MKILLLDTQHFEVLQTLIRLFGQFGHRMKVYTTAGSHAQLVPALQGYQADTSWELQAGNESRTRFAMRFAREIRTGLYDLVVLATVADNHLIIAEALRKTPAQRSLLTIHSLNGHFHYSLSTDLKALVRYAGKRQLVKRVNAIHVLGEVVAAEYRRIAGRKLAGKKLFVIPGSIYEPGKFDTARLQEGGPVRLVLAGAIDERRREYNDVFGLLEACRSKGIQVHVTLMGAVQPDYSKAVAAQVTRYQSQYDNLDCVGWDEDVPQEQFDQVIAKSHFIWMPFRQAMVIQDGVREYYGRSMNSGNLGDAIRYAKPFFIPDFIGMDASIREAALAYRTVHDIVGILEKLTPESYAALQQVSLRASDNFSIGKLTAQNELLFRDLLPG